MSKNQMDATMEANGSGHATDQNNVQMDEAAPQLENNGMEIDE